MVTFVRSINKGIGDSYSTGYVLEFRHVTIVNLFGKEQLILVTFKDLFTRDIIRDAIISPSGKATVIKLESPRGLITKFKEELKMIGSSILLKLAEIRKEYDLNYQQAEFILLAFYIEHRDAEAFKTHVIWRDHTVVKEDLIDFNKVDVDIDTRGFHRTEVPYLSDADIEGLINTGFFLTLTLTSFKIDRKKYYNEIFITKQIAYQQLCNVFRFTSINVSNINYKVNNVVSRSIATDEYWESIEGLASKHAQVMEACEYAITNELVQVGLSKIIANEVYFEWLDEMNGGSNAELDDGFAPEIMV